VTKKRDPLMDRVDRALAQWPVRGRSGLELDEMADRIASRAVADGGIGSEGDLLRPPLPASAGERRGRVMAGWWTALGGIAAVAAVAASVLVGLRHEATDDARRVSVDVPVRPGATPSPLQAHPSFSSPSSAPSALVDEPGIDPSDLPRVAANDRRAMTPAAAHASGAPKTGILDPTMPTVPTTGTGVPRGGPGAGAPDSLQPAAAVAAGSGLAGGPDSIPLRPSMGAVQSALGVAGRATRGCLAAGDAVSRATVTFRSDGSVSDVAVSGSAAGTPAEGCIRVALAKAQVPPFAEPSFAAPVTVRPN